MEKTPGVIVHRSMTPAVWQWLCQPLEIWFLAIGDDLDLSRSSTDCIEHVTLQQQYDQKRPVSGIIDPSNLCDKSKRPVCD